MVKLTEGYIWISVYLFLAISGKKRYNKTIKTVMIPRKTGQETTPQGISPAWRYIYG